MNQAIYPRVIQLILALTGALFGLVTVFAGVRVLTGSDPGYVVFLPLLIYNTLMGLLYIWAGWLAWRHLAQGKKAAAAIFMLNLVVLIAIGVFHFWGGAVAVASLYAMTFRTVVWLLLFVGLAWLAFRASNALARGES